MTAYVRRLALAAVLVSLAGDQIVAARENPTIRPNQEETEVSVRNKQIFMRTKASEDSYRAGFFPQSGCQVDDGLIINFKDGFVTANTKGDGLMGGRVEAGAMTFHIGNESCQIEVQIRRRPGYGQ